MQRQNIKGSLSLNDLLVLFLACGFGLIVGVACMWFSGLVVFGALGIILLGYATLKRPEIAILGILIATSSIVFEDQLPMVSVGISLHLSDFLLLGSLVLIFLRSMVEPDFKLVRTPLNWLLLIFYGITLFWTFNAILHSLVEVEVARRMIRVMTYYMTFFIVINLVRERRQLNLLLNGLFFLATIVAGVMVAQYLLGRSVVLLPGRVEALNTQGVAYTDITRILPPGVSIVLVAFVAIFCTLVLEKSNSSGWLKVLHFGLLGMAVLFTFLRSYWGALIVVFFLLGFILKGDDRRKLVKWSILIIVPISIILLFISSVPDSDAAGLIGASRDRISTIFTIETFQGKDGSLNSRKIENRYALRQILSHPLEGLGLGSFYRPFDSRIDDLKTADPRGSMFIHNGHLWILLDTGLFGYLAFMGLSVVFLFRAFLYWRSVPEYKLQGIVLGFALIYLAALIAASVNSVFVQWQWTPVIGMIMGVNEVILMKFGQTDSVT